MQPDTGKRKRKTMKMKQSEAEFYLRPMEEKDLEAAAELERLSFSVPWSEAVLRESLESSLDLIWVLE